MTVFLGGLARARASVVRVQALLVGAGGALTLLAARRAQLAEPFGVEELVLAAGVWFALALAYLGEERRSLALLADRADAQLGKQRALVTAFEREAEPSAGPFDGVLGEDALSGVRFGPVLAAACPASGLALLAPLLGGAVLVVLSSSAGGVDSERLASLAGSAARELQQALGELGRDEDGGSSELSEQLAATVSDLERAERSLAEGDPEEEWTERLAGIEERLEQLARIDDSPRSALRLDRARGAVEELERMLGEEPTGPSSSGPEKGDSGDFPPAPGQAAGFENGSNSAGPSGASPTAAPEPNSGQELVASSTNSDHDSGAGGLPARQGAGGGSASSGAAVLPLELDDAQRELVEAWISSRDGAALRR